MNRPWTIQEEQYLRENYPVKPTKDIIMYRSKKAIASRAKLLGITKKGSLARRPWTQQENEYLLQHYPDTLTDNIAKLLGRSRTSVNGQAYKLGLHKSESFKLSEQSGRLTGRQGMPTRFKKGHTPANKGKKMPEELYEKCSVTMFRKGNIPKNHKPVGTISIRGNHKREQHYLYIKLAEPNKWEFLHRHVWEKANGPIPKGMNLVFKDGNQNNCSLDNLELISNDQLMIRNTIHRYPEELKEAIRILGQTKRKIRRYEKSAG